MRSIEELVQQLQTASGESLHRVIQELGNRGAEARDALWPLCDLARDLDDRVARGHAVLAVGLIDPFVLDIADGLADCGDAEQAARKAASMLNQEAAKVLATMLVYSDFMTSGADHAEELARSRAILLNQIARRFPSMIPGLVKSLTREPALGDWLVETLCWIGEDHPEVATLLAQLYDHESRAVRSAAISVCGTTGRMPIGDLPRLIAALREDQDSGKLRFALCHMAELHPREVITTIIDTQGVDGLDLLILSEPNQRVIEMLVEELIRFLHSPEKEVCRKAVQILGGLSVSAMSPGAIEVVPRLRELLDDSDKKVRNAALATIKQIEH